VNRKIPKPVAILLFIVVAIAGIAAGKAANKNHFMQDNPTTTVTTPAPAHATVGGLGAGPVRLARP